jgi:hypothetical protein
VDALVLPTKKGGSMVNHQMKLSEKKIILMLFFLPQSGPSFEVLLDQIKRKKGVDQNSSSTARRRRWLKSKKCVSPELLEIFKQKFNDIKDEAEKLKRSARNRAKNNVAIEFYEKRRVQAYQWSSTLAANKCIELVAIFKEFRDKLSNMYVFDLNKLLSIL